MQETDEETNATQLPVMAPPSLLGGRYRFERALAEGGLGSVYLAHDNELDRLVVIKRARQPDSPRLAGLLEREARLLAQIHSPNVVGYVDLIAEKGRSYLVQEYIDDAVPLDTWQYGRAVPNILHTYATIAEALDTIHGASIVHRDLKPANVLVRDTGPVIIDFSVAVDTRKPDELTGLDVVAGTPAFLPPEAIRGGVVPNAAVDIFALGVMLFEALTGRYPEGPDENVRGFLTSRAMGRQEALAWRVLAKFDGVLSLVHEMLDLEPSQRPSARTVAARLRAAATDPDPKWISPLYRTSPQSPMGSPDAPEPPPFAPAQGARVSKPQHHRSEEASAPSVESPRAATPSPSIEPAAPQAKRSTPRILVVAATIFIALLAFGSVKVFAVSRWSGALIWAFLLLAAAAGGVLGVRLIRSRPPPAPPDVARRIAAIEAHIERTKDFTQSLSINLEEMLKGRVEHALRESLLIALRDLAPTEQTPSSKITALVDRLEKLNEPRPSKPFAERVAAAIAVPAAFITAAVAAVGLLNSLQCWQANRQPEITAVVANRARVRPAGFVTFQVDAKDPDGESLRFEYTTTAGTIDGDGPSARLHAPADPKSPMVTMTVRVLDRHGHTAEKNQSVLIKSPPHGKLVLPADATVGTTVELRADVVDEDPAALKYEWHTSAGTIEPGSGTVVFWKTPDVPADKVHILCVVNDDLGAVSLRADVQVNPKAP